MKTLTNLLLTLFLPVLSVAQGTQPFVLGTIATLHSEILKEDRVINIYFPEGYNSKDTIRYSVIYLLDGSADEDFIHIAGLVQFCNFSWVNILPKSIVVGIENVDRKRDYTFPTTVEKDKKDYPTTGGSEKFIAFIEKELQPYIDRNCRTNSERMLIGQSLGGLLAVEILFKKPQLFNSYVVVSPSLWWDNESLLKVKPYFWKDPRVKVFIAVGNEEKLMQDDSRKLVEILNADGLEPGFEYMDDQSHATIMHNAVYKGFQYLYKK